MCFGCVENGRTIRPSRPWEGELSFQGNRFHKPVVWCSKLAAHAATLDAKRVKRLHVDLRHHSFYSFCMFEFQVHALLVVSEDKSQTQEHGQSTARQSTDTLRRCWSTFAQSDDGTLPSKKLLCK